MTAEERSDRITNYLQFLKSENEKFKEENEELIEELERKDEYCLEFKRKEIENHKEEIRKLKMDNKLLELKQQKLRDRVVFLHKQLQTNRADKLMALNFSKSLNKVEGTSVLGSNNLTTGGENNSHLMNERVQYYVQLEKDAANLQVKNLELELVETRIRLELAKKQMEKKQHREEGSPAPDEFELKKQAEAYEALVLLVEKLVTVKARCESAINEQQLEKIAQSKDQECRTCPILVQLHSECVADLEQIGIDNTQLRKWNKELVDLRYCNYKQHSKQESHFSKYFRQFDVELSEIRSMPMSAGGKEANWNPINWQGGLENRDPERAPKSAGSSHALGDDEALAADATEVVEHYDGPQAKRARVKQELSTV